MRDKEPSNLLPILVVGVGVGIFGAIILASSSGINLFDGASADLDPRIKSARSFENQYAMQKGAKAPAADLCARSKLVAEAYLQAEAQEKYREWTVKSQADCAIADVEATR